MYFNRIIDTAYVGMNVYADYYRTLLGFNSDGDILDEPDYDMYIHYLKARIKDRRSKGAINMTQDADFQLWLLRKNEALKKEHLETEIRISPEISHLPMPE